MSPKSILQIDNVSSRLVTTDHELVNVLHESLRFRPKNFWHSAAYKNKKWDGWQDFFNRKSGRFLTGLLPEVQLIIRSLKKECSIVDQRIIPQWGVQSIDNNFLKSSLPPGMKPFELHDFQPDFVNKCIHNNRGIVKAPTGAGKTFILISILKALPPRTPVLFLTKNASLVHQNWQEMKAWNVPNLGRWYSKYKEPNFVTCATVHKKTFESLDKLLPKFKVLLVDEVHDCMSDVPVAAYRKMTNAAIRIGFSATPFKWNKKTVDKVHKYTVKGHFGSVFKTSTTESGSLTTKDLQDRSILSKSNCNVYVIDKPDLRHEPFQDAVKLGIEQNFHFHQIVARLAKTRKGRTLIVVERIEQGEYLHQLIPGSHWIQGKNSLKEREPVINALKSGEKSIAIVMKPLITAGINVRIHDLINAAGGEAAQNVIQQMGRGLRPADDKDVLQYHDFLFLMNDYLQKHSEWRIEVLENEGHPVEIHDKLPF